MDEKCWKILSEKVKKKEKREERERSGKIDAFMCRLLDLSPIISSIHPAGYYDADSPTVLL